MSVLIRPLITEKMTDLQAKLNQYCFEVDIHATKADIKKAVKQMYPHVTIEKVNTTIVASKPKGRYTRSGFVSGRSKKWKKAIVTIGEGQEIDFYSEI